MSDLRNAPGGREGSHRLGVRCPRPEESDNDPHDHAASLFRAVSGGVCGTSFGTGWGWASRPAKRNENRWYWTEYGAGSGEIEINHGAIEAEQLCDPERA